MCVAIFTSHKVIGRIECKHRPDYFWEIVSALRVKGKEHATKEIHCCVPFKQKNSNNIRTIRYTTHAHTLTLSVYGKVAGCRVDLDFLICFTQ